MNEHVEDFLRPSRDTFDSPARTPMKHPSGWEPGVDTERGEVIHRSEMSSPPDDEDWSYILEQLGLDPKLWTVVSDRVNVRTWDANIGNSVVQRFYYYKADVRPRGRTSDADFEALLREVRSHKRLKTSPPGGDSSLFVALSDWQLGKAGYRETQQRLLDKFDMLEDRVRDLRKWGVDVGTLYVGGLGDLVENCDGFYPRQAFATELDIRQQVKLARRLLWKGISQWSKHFEQVVVFCVPGNHGEKRREGQAYTSFGDNYDVELFEQVHDISRENPRYDHVRYAIPDESLTMTLDVSGVIASFAHGHQFRRGSTVEQKALNWWKDMTHARHPVGDSDLLVTGHYHHLCIKQDGPRTWIQAPSEEQPGSSQYWTEGGGASAPPGTLTMVVGDAFRDKGGWSHLEVL